MTRPDITLAREFEAALAWWQAAGVDCDYHDDATAWLADAPLGAPVEAGAKPGAAPQRQAPPPARAAPTAEPSKDAAATLRRDLLGESPPADLAAFRTWWMAAPELGTARSFPRISPRGPQGAALMVLSSTSTTPCCELNIARTDLAT